MFHTQKRLAREAREKEIKNIQYCSACLFTHFNLTSPIDRLKIVCNPIDFYFITFASTYNIQKHMNNIIILINCRKETVLLNTKNMCRHFDFKSFKDVRASVIARVFISKKQRYLLPYDQTPICSNFQYLSYFIELLWAIK